MFLTPRCCHAGCCPGVSCADLGFSGGEQQLTANRACNRGGWEGAALPDAAAAPSPATVPDWAAVTGRSSCAWLDSRSSGTYPAIRSTTYPDYNGLVCGFMVASVRGRCASCRVAQQQHAAPGHQIKARFRKLGFTWCNTVHGTLPQWHGQNPTAHGVAQQLSQCTYKIDLRPSRVVICAPLTPHHHACPFDRWLTGGRCRQARARVCGAGYHRPAAASGEGARLGAAARQPRSQVGGRQQVVPRTAAGVESVECVLGGQAGLNGRRLQRMLEKEWQEWQDKGSLAG